MVLPYCYLLHIYEKGLDEESGLPVSFVLLLFLGYYIRNIQYSTR